MYDGKAVRPSKKHIYRKLHSEKEGGRKGNQLVETTKVLLGTRITEYIRTFVPSLLFFVVIIIIVIGVGISAQEGAIAHVLKRLFLNALAIARK